MDKWEKAIREKVHAANILTEGEWVYLVGLFGMAKDHADCDGPPEIERLTKERDAAQGTADDVYRRLMAEIERLRAVVVDMLAGLAYLRSTNRVPYGFGIDRLEATGNAALGHQQEGDGK